MKFEDVWMLLPEHTVGFGDLEIADGKIASIDLKPTVAGAARPGPGARLVLPGLVNCHGHTAMTLVRGLGGGLPLQRWLNEAIFPVEAKMTPADVAAGMAWGAMEMLAGGTTAVADMYDFPGEGGRVFAEIGMKARVCRVGLSFVPGRLQDCIDFTRSFNAASIRNSRSSIFNSQISDSRSSIFNSQISNSRCSIGGSQLPINDSQSTIDNCKIAIPPVVADLCIHSEYLTDEQFCRDLAAANRELKRPLHVHVSETRKEHEECIARHGMTPIAYLAQTGLLDFGGYAAHCVWCTDEDFAIMREKNVTLVHNPSSNMKLGSGFARVPAAIAAGVNVALGTDGCASNDNLDLFEEMHLASLVHKGLAQDPTVLSAWEVIDMATKNGAKALGLADSGELKVGNAADLCVVDLDKPHLTPALDLANLVVHSMHASDVVLTMVDGEILYERGQFMTLNQERVEFDFRCAVRRLFA